jgi:hypothetical protein
VIVSHERSPTEIFTVAKTALQLTGVCMCKIAGYRGIFTILKKNIDPSSLRVTAAESGPNWKSWIFMGEKLRTS